MYDDRNPTIVSAREEGGKKKRDQRKKAKKRRAKYIYIPPTFICIYRERERERGSEGKGGKLNRRARNRPRELRHRRTYTARRTKPSRKPQQPYRCHQSFFSRRSISLFFHAAVAFFSFHGPVASHYCYTVSTHRASFTLLITIT